jgi:hypothetical protein
MQKKWTYKILDFLKSFLPLTPQIKYSFLMQGVWFLLRRVKRLGSAKPWQPTRQPAGNGAKT